MTLIHKHEIRRAFNAATQTYDANADWQKTVGNILLSYIDRIQPMHKTIVDLGSGTGYLAKHIQQRHPNNQLIALDIAESMLRFSKQHLHQNELICADAEDLPLKNNSIDIIVSNMVLHWCDSLEKTLQEQYKALSKNGVFVFSILGPESLQSLKQAWYHIDQHAHINTFPDAKTVCEACQSVGFSLQRFERHDIKKQYDNVYALMQHLKSTGAKNISEKKPNGLMGKQKIKRLNDYYENPLNYEIFTAICQK